MIFIQGDLINKNMEKFMGIPTSFIKNELKREQEASPIYLAGRIVPDNWSDIKFKFLLEKIKYER